MHFLFYRLHIMVTLYGNIPYIPFNPPIASEFHMRASHSSLDPGLARAYSGDQTRQEKAWVWLKRDMFYVRFLIQTLHVSNSACNSPPVVNFAARVRNTSYWQCVTILSFLVKALPSVKKTLVAHASCSLPLSQMTLHIVDFQI